MTKAELVKENETLRAQYTIARNVILSCREVAQHLPEGWEPKPEHGLRAVEAAEVSTKIHAERIHELREQRNEITNLLRKWYDAGTLTKEQITEYFNLILLRP